jgi:hypothetical protein
MWFQKDQRIREAGGPVTRWRVEDCRHDPTVTFVKLRDDHHDIKVPMVRTAVGVCINYHDKRVDDWMIQDWRRQFVEACEAASGNFAGLPEPLDFYHIRTTDREVPDHLRDLEPFFVYTYGQAREVFRLHPDRVSDSEDLARQVKNFVYDLAYILRALHQNGLVLRQLPLTSLRWLPVMRKYFLGEFLSLSRQGPSEYHPNIPFLVLQPCFSAPECFDSAGRLTPATDVFALGKTLLMWLGRRFQYNEPVLSDVAAALAEIDIKFRPMLPEPVVRFLKLALQRDPRQRPQHMGEVMALITGREPAPPPKPVPSRKSNPRKPRF